MYQTSLTKGQELVAQRMVKEFRRQGHEAHLITGAFHDQAEVVSDEELTRRGGLLYSFDEALSIPVLRVRSRQENWPPRRVTFVDFVASLDRIVEDLKLDVLITHSTLWNGPEETAKFIQWKRNQAKGGAPVRQLVFLHMSHFQEPTDERYDLPERTFREAWNTVSLPMVMKLADFVLVTTPFEKDQMKKLGVEESKLLLFPGGIDSTSLEAEKIDFRSKFGIPPTKKVVAYLGTVEERKNALAVVKVAKVLEGRQDLHFVVSGQLEGSYGQKARAACTDVQNVSLTGPIPEEDYPSLIAESYLNINMSRSEALGLTQLEFMYNGVPVITSGVGGQAWIVRDGSSGVVLAGPDDVGGAADAITRLADSPRKREKLGTKSREIASQFTMPKLIRALSRTLEARLGGLRGGEVGFEPGEVMVEALTKKGFRVVVTTKRLLVSSGGRRRATEVRLEDITGLSRGTSVPWRIVLVGGAASVALLAAEGASSQVSAALVALVSAGMDPPGPIQGALGVVAALLPVVVSGLTTLLRSRRGYAVESGERVEAFVPEGFEKALRRVDELTPRSLLTNAL